MKFCIRQVLIAIGAILLLTFIVQSYIYSSYLRGNASEIATNSLKSDLQCTEVALKVAFMKNHKCAIIIALPPEFIPFELKSVDVLD